MERSLLWIIVFSVKLYLGKSHHQNVYEDDKVLAFLDISQATKGHTWLFLKNTFATFWKCLLRLLRLSLAVFQKLPVPCKKTTGAIGMNILNNNEEVAGQTVFHAHIHLVPRYGADDGIHMSFDEHEPDFAALANLADSIAKEVTE